MFWIYYKISSRLPIRIYWFVFALTTIFQFIIETIFTFFHVLLISAALSNALLIFLNSLIVVSYYG